MRISVVIPTWNEAGCIAPAVRRAWAAGADEVIVADGGSDDGTLAAARRATCILVESPRGRARQQNAGAAAASGDVLVFLHADCWLAPGALGQVRAAVAQGATAGAFRQRIVAVGWKYRALERGNNVRAGKFARPYGDQGLFVTRRIFERAGGFPDVPLLEDLLLVRALRREASLALLPGPIYVSPRRWKHNGVVRQTLRNWLIVMLHALGASPDRLARWYAR